MIDEKRLIEHFKKLKGADSLANMFIKDVIKEIKKQPKIGEWIPCNERLPKENEDVEVTVEEDADEVGGKRYYNIRSWLQKGQWVIKKNPYHPKVIAWKYPAEPYKPEDFDCKGRW